MTKSGAACVRGPFFLAIFPDFRLKEDLNVRRKCEKSIQPGSGLASSASPSIFCQFFLA